MRTVLSRDFRQSTNETESSHFGSQFSGSQVPGLQIINIPIKWFMAKKSVVLNDDEPRPVPIPKDFAHLMIRKIDEVCFNIFLTQVSAFAYLIVIYNSLFTIHYFIFHFKCCSILHFAVCQLLCWAFLLRYPTFEYA